MAGVAMSNAVAVRSAVACMVRSPLLVGVIAAAPPPAATPAGRKLVMEGFDPVGKGGVGCGKRGVRGDKLLKDSLLVGGCAGIEGIVDGVKEAELRVVAWAELAWPR